MKIAGSFLKIQNENDKIKKLNEVVDQIHFDIMDGIFTENKTKDIEKINIENITKEIDVHLMVTDINQYIEEVLKIKPTYITFHLEAAKKPENNIKKIQENNIKVGLAINPETEIEKLYPYLNNIDLVLVMSVPPGKGGQKFIDISDKIEKLYNYRKQHKLSYIIEVDGGINDKTISKIKKADIAVSGSYITDSDDYKKQVKKLKHTVNKDVYQK